MLPNANPRSGSSVLPRLFCPASVARAFALAGLLLIAATVVRAQMTIVPTITTAAGNGMAGYSGDGGLATSAELHLPADVAFDSSGNWYIADYSNCRIRKVTIATGDISTVAGNGTCGYNADGIAATSAELNNPNSVAIDSSGNIYVADDTNNRVRKVTVSTGLISTVAGTGAAGYSGDGAAATSAKLNSPSGIALDSSGNIYIADRLNNRIREVAIATGFIGTVAGSSTSCSPSTSACGDGSAATSAKLNGPNAVALDSSGNIYIADIGDNRIRKVTISSGHIGTVAGNGNAGYSGDGGAATSAEINGPRGVALDSSGNIYISDYGNYRIREVNAGTSNISTLAGNGTNGSTGNNGPATSAEFVPNEIELDNLGNLYIADSFNCVVRKVQINTTFPGTTLGSSSAVQNFFLETTAAETLTSIAAQQSQGSKNEYSIGTITGCTVNGITSNPSGTFCTVPITFKPAYPGPRNVPLTAVTGTGNVTFGLTGTGTGPLAVLTPGTLSTAAGNGTAGSTGNGGAATSAELNDPVKLAIDSAGNLYISDYNNYEIRKVTASTGNISVVAGTGTGGYSGDGGAASSAQLKNPSGVGIDRAGNLYIADKKNCRIRKVTVATGTIVTVAGTGSCGFSGDGSLATNAEVNQPSSDIVFDAHGNWYFGDGSNHRVRMVAGATGIITTVAGNGTAGYTGDGGAATSAEVNNVSGVALDGSGNLYIADFGQAVVRMVTGETGIITTVAGNGTAGYAGDGEAATSAEIQYPGGIAIDPAGDLYIADSVNARIRVVNAASGQISTLAGNGTAGYAGDAGAATSGEMNSPQDITLDSAGNLYIADSSNNRIRQVNVSNSSLTYATPTAVGTLDGTDDPQTATVTNIGNASLTISVPSSGTNPSVSAYFELDATTTCPELTTSSSAETLAAGSNCTYAVNFEPTAAGSVSGSVVLTDNTLGVTGSTQTVSLTATSIKGTPPITWSNPAAITYGTPLSSTQLDASSTLSGTFVYTPSSGTVLSAGSQTLSVTFNPTDTTDYNSATDNVTLMVNPVAPTIAFTASNQTYGVSPFAVSATSNSAGAITYSVVSGPATISGSTVTITGVGTVVLQASQAASGNYTAGTQNASFTVSKATPTVALSSSSNPSTYSGSVAFTATVPASATGIVTFLDGATSIGTGSVSSGASTLTTALLTGGSHSITAQYGGDSNYNAATSSVVMEVVDQTSVTISIIATENPSIYGDMVTFTFTFTGSGSAIPTGTATITEDGNALTTIALDGAGKATYPTSAMTASSHTFQAVYNGDLNYK